MATQAEVDLAARKPRPGKFVWFEHVSRDARRAQEFYAKLFGWRVVPWSGSDSAYEMIATGDSMESMIGGYDAPKNDRQPSHWIAYVSVEDVDATAKAAGAHGGRVVEPPYDLPGIGRAARIADPQGAELSLFRNNAGDPDDLSASEARAPGRFFWNELHTTDPINAVSFYEKVLGFTHKTMSGPGGDYHILSRDGVDRGGVTVHLDGAQPHWLPYVAVEDADTTIARARSLGARVITGPHDIPGVGRFGVLADPTGAVLAVKSRR